MASQCSASEEGLRVLAFSVTSESGSIFVSDDQKIALYHYSVMWWLILSSTPRVSSSWTSLFSQFAHTCSALLLYINQLQTGASCISNPPAWPAHSLYTRSNNNNPLYCRFTYLRNVVCQWRLSISQFVFVYSVFNIFLITKVSSPHGNVRLLVSDRLVKITYMIINMFQNAKSTIEVTDTNNIYKFN